MVVEVVVAAGVLMVPFVTRPIAGFEFGSGSGSAPGSCRPRSSTDAGPYRRRVLWEMSRNWVSHWRWRPWKISDLAENLTMQIVFVFEIVLSDRQIVVIVSSSSLRSVRHPRRLSARRRQKQAEKQNWGLRCWRWLQELQKMQKMQKMQDW